MLTRLKTSLAAIGPDPLRLSASTAFGAFPIGFLNIVLPIYFNKVGLDSSIIGQLYAVSAVTSAVLLVLFGLLADRFGRKPFVIGGTLLPAVSYAIFLGTTDPVWLTLAAGIGGVGLANGLSGVLAGSSFNALLAEKTSDENRTMVFSLGSAAWTGALMAGALLGGLPEWLQSLGFGLVDSYRPLFWLSLLMAALAALVIVPIRERHTERSVHERPSLIPRRSLGAISRLTLVWGIIGLGLGFSVQLLSLWFYLKFNVSGDFLGPWYASSEALSMAAM